MSVNKVILIGRLGKDPETRYMTNGEAVTNATLATSENWKDKSGEKQEKTEWHNLVFYRRLAEIAGAYLGKGEQVAIECRLQTRSWEDERGARHWKTEIVASHVEMLSGRRKKDYEAQQAADSLSAQAEAYGEAPPTEPIPEPAEVTAAADDDDEDQEDAAA